MGKGSYQKQEWKRNRNKIIEILTKEAIPFSELINRSGLSRAVVYNHLESLQDDGWVRKVYDRKKRKIVNVLQLSKIELVEWFLSKLEKDVPKQIVDKGRNILSDQVLINSSIIYGYILNNTYDILAASELEEAAETEAWLPERFSLIPSKTEAPDIKFETRSKTEREIIQRLISELNAYVFNVVLTVYQIEKWLFKKWSKELKKRNEFFFSTLSQDMKRSFDATSEWWFKEVSEYLPSSRFFQLLACIYSNSLSRRLRQKESEKS